MLTKNHFMNCFYSNPIRSLFRSRSSLVILFKKIFFLSRLQSKICCNGIVGPSWSCHLDRIYDMLLIHGNTCSLTGKPAPKLCWVIFRFFTRFWLSKVSDADKKSSGQMSCSCKRVGTIVCPDLNKKEYNPSLQPQAHAGLTIIVVLESVFSVRALKMRRGSPRRLFSASEIALAHQCCRCARQARAKDEVWAAIIYNINEGKISNRHTLVQRKADYPQGRGNFVFLPFVTHLDPSRWFTLEVFSSVGGGLIWKVFAAIFGALLSEQMRWLYRDASTWVFYDLKCIRNSDPLH